MLSEDIIISNKRLFDRFSARFPAKLKDAREDFGSNISLRDASACGIKLTTKDRMYLNDKVTLEVKLPDDGLPMILKGEVAWVKSQDLDMWDIGVRFYKIDLMHISRLYKHVAHENSSLN